MFSSKLVQTSKLLLANGVKRNPNSLRYMSLDIGDADKCAGYGNKRMGRCAKKVAVGCRTPNESVKCVSLSIEVPCEKIRPPFPSFLEMLQAQDIFKLQKTCRNECCCQAHFRSMRRPLQTDFFDMIHIESKC